MCLSAKMDDSLVFSYLEFQAISSINKGVIEWVAFLIECTTYALAKSSMAQNLPPKTCGAKNVAHG